MAIGTVTSFDTTDGSVTSVPGGVKYTVTSLDNSNPKEAGKPTKQMTYDTSHAAESVSLFGEQSWSAYEKTWLIGRVTSFDTTDGRVTSVPEGVKYTVTSLDNSNPKEAGIPTTQVTYDASHAAESVSLFGEQSWSASEKTWLIGTVTSFDTTDGSVTSVPGGVKYTVTSLDNSNPKEAGMPTKQVTYDASHAAESVSLFGEQSWSASEKTWLIGTVTSFDTTDGSVTSVPGGVKYTVTSLDNSNPKEAGMPTKQVTYDASHAAESVSLFGEQSWSASEKTWLIGTVTSFDTTDGSVTSVPGGVKYTVTSLDNSNPKEAGMPTKQVTYDASHAAESVSLFGEQSWSASEKTWLIGTVTSFDTTDGSVTSVPGGVKYTVTSLDNSNPKEAGMPTKQVTYDASHAAESVSLFGEQSWSASEKTWLIGTVTSFDTTDGSVTSVPEGVKYTVTSLDNSNPKEAGMPTKQVTYDASHAAESVSLFGEQSWSASEKTWLIGTVTSFDTTDGSVTSVPEGVKYTVTSLDNSNPKEAGMPTKQVTYDASHAAESVSLFGEQSWSASEKTWLIGTVTSFDTTDGSVTSVPGA